MIKDVPNMYVKSIGHLVALRLRHYATSRKVAGSSTDEVNVFNYLILPAALGPEIYSASNYTASASNRNKYQKQNNNDSGE
jgi:hypothetical protein